MIWTRAADIDAVRRRLDLNDDDQLTGLAATPNEWSILAFDGGSIGKQIEIGRLFDFARSQYQKMRVPELTEQQRRRVQQSLTRP